MPEKALKEFSRNQIRAIELCFSNKLHMSALILLYSAIDIFASSTRKKEKVDVTRDDFIRWCDKYILNNCNIGCSSIDLYSARCSVLHTCTASSDLTRRNKAKEILYAWGNKKPGELQEKLREIGKNNSIVIHIDTLIEGLKRGLKQFMFDIENIAEMNKLVVLRSKKIFKNTPEV